MKNFIFYIAISFSAMSFASSEELNNMATSPNKSDCSTNPSPLSRKDRLSAEKRNAFNNTVLEMQITAAIIAKQPERTRHAALGDTLGQPRRN